MLKTNFIKLNILVVLTLFVTTGMWAQNITVKGTVKDALGEVIIGANVILKGANTGTITDVEGDYTISVPSNSTLQFSFIGYQSQEISVSGRNVIDIILKEDSEQIDEVVVVGYGIQRKSDLTGSVSSVKSEDMLTVSTTNVGEMLRGRVAGVEITQSSARPGGTSQILIRGKRSLSADNGPLFIVDGVPADNIDDINANDIKSLEVLKDASSQAIYGARASAGVILVTTFRGETGAAKIDVSANFAVQNLKRNFDLFTGEEWVGLLLAQNGIYGGVNAASIDDIQSAIGDNMLYDNYLRGIDTNWEKELIRSAYQQTYNISVRGGTENTKVMSSLNFYQQDGMINNTGYKRGTMRINVDQKLSRTVSMGANMSFNRSEQRYEDGAEGGSSTGGGSTLIQQAMVLSPYARPYDDEGNLLKFVNSDNKFNPIWNTNESSDICMRNNLALNLFVDWQIIEGLKYRLNANFNYRDSKRQSYESTEHEQGLKKEGWGQFRFDFQRDWLIENILTYNKGINENNRFDITLVQSANGLREERFTQSAEQFMTDYFGVNGIEGANKMNKSSRSITPRQIASFMGRIRYALYDRYLFTASLRADGSSVFGPQNKWGYFPSAAFAWRINQEDFLIDNQTISNLKLRLSYGIVGNQGVGAYQTTANTSGYQMLFGNQGSYVQGLLPSSKMANPYLKWEKTKSYNLGVDFGFFNERITGSIELYNTNTSDLLVNRALSSATGYASQMINLGKVNNKGIELQMGATFIRKYDFNWSANLTFSKNNNEIVKIDGRTDINGKPLDQPNNNWFIGKSIDVYYDYRFDGVFNDIEEVRVSAQGKDADGNPLSDDDLLKKVGSIRVKDIDSNGVINEDDRDFYNRTPKWIASLSTTLNYKGFDLFLDFYTSQGAIRRNSYLYDYNQGGTYSGKLNGIKRNYWTPDGKGQEAPIPRLNYTDTYARSMGYQDASYIRLRTIQLGYNFKPEWTRKLGMTNARIYGTLTNFFTWTDFQSFSPESSPSSYPEPKTATVGLNFSF